MSDGAARAGDTAPVAAFYPSLHLNLAECYRRCGDPDRAREHLELARAASSALPDDAYGQQIRDSLAQVEQHLREPHLRTP